MDFKIKGFDGEFKICNTVKTLEFKDGQIIAVEEEKNEESNNKIHISNIKQNIII